MGTPLSTAQDYFMEGLLGPGGALLMRNILGQPNNPRNNASVDRIVQGLLRSHNLRGGSTTPPGQTIAPPDMIDYLQNPDDYSEGSNISWSFLIDALYNYMFNWDVFFFVGTRMFHWDEETTRYNHDRVHAFMRDAMNAESRMEQVLIFYEFAFDVGSAIVGYHSNRAAIDGETYIEVYSTPSSEDHYYPSEPSTSEGPSSEDGIIDARRRITPPSENSEEEYAMEPRGRYNDSSFDFSQIDLSEDLVEDILTWIPQRYNFEQFHLWIKKKNKEFAHIYVSA